MMVFTLSMSTGHLAFWTSNNLSATICDGEIREREVSYEMYFLGLDPLSVLKNWFSDL